MRPIRELPADVVNKIAAGEVVERPSSAVKELLENSVDAGASQIVVEAIEGGRDLLRVVDDGCGIPREQLPLAVRAHATSKLDNADDLFRIRTLGFRGEALSSIAGVSEFSIKSRPVDQPTGSQIEVVHGIVGPVVECACPPGTQIEVRNLFASVPVRRKFLKTKQTELGHISDAMTRIALSAPAVALKLVHNDRIIFERPASMDRKASIGLFFGKDVEGALLPAEAELDGVRVHGLVCDPRVDRPNNRMQYLFINGRFFRDRSLSHALTEAFRGLLMTGRYPIAFMFIEMPPDLVDVNVHPTKTEVRFQNPHLVFSLVLNAIKSRFLSSDLVAKLRVKVAETPQPAATSQPTAFDFDEAATRFADRKEEIHRDFALSAPAPVAASNLWPDDRRPWPPQPEPNQPSQPNQPAQAASTNPLIRPTMRVNEIQAPWNQPSTPSDRLGTSTTAPSTNGHSASGSSPTQRLPESQRPLPTTIPTPPFSKAIQLHNSYLVVEEDDGMMLVDQHALHERILYEELRERVGAQKVEIQELLVPEPVEMSQLQAGLILEQKEVLSQMGIRIEDFGPRCVLLQGYPAMLRRLEPQELLQSIAGHLEETGKSPTRDQMLENLLHLVACKAAVKAGDPLEPGEIDALLARRHDVEDSHHCPHGRPTLLKFTLRDLERQFKRT